MRNVTAGSKACADSFPTNQVTNTKYNLFTFIPKNLYEQFHRPLNLYFLAVGILQFIPIIAPVNPLTTVGPLLFAFTLTALKEGYDDFQRQQQDRVFNERRYTVYRQGADWGDETGELEVKSAEIRVGDVVLLKDHDEIPCDVFLISSSDEEGLAYIRTDNLDGEIDLKPRQAADRVLKHTNGHDAQRWSGTVTCDEPNKKLYLFNSRLDTEQEKDVSVSGQQLLLQSCFLQNTEYAYGLAVYTGNQTKCGMNKKETPDKWATLDRTVSRYCCFVFAFQICLAFTLGTVGGVRRHEDRDRLWYLAYGDDDWYHQLIIPARFFLLTSVMIPISFKVIIDLSKYYISMAIGWDVNMYDPTIDPELGGCPARANNTAIAEDLGQIQFVMTDKTGTLTENIMAFKLASVDGAIWGGGGGLVPDVTISALSDEAFLRKARSGDGPLTRFARHLGLCHTVALKDGHYSASSPDEEALVRAADTMGVRLKARTKNDLTIVHDGRAETHAIVHTFEFTSDRKMMSLLLRSPDGALTLFTKGADSVMLPLLSADPVTQRTAERHLDIFAASGLRTLVVAQRSVAVAEWEAWRPHLDAAMASTGEEREAKVNATYKQMERDLEFVGCTAIEDKLQDEVPETIAALREANVSFWMLTGDKYETARQIARSCNLWAEGEQLHSIRSQGEKPVAQQLREIADVLPKCRDDGKRLCDRRSSLERGLMDTHVDLEMTQLEQMSGSSPRRGNCLIIEGSALEELLGDEVGVVTEHQRLLRDVGFRCNSVVCCRVTPAQKARVTRLVKGSDDPPPPLLQRLLYGRNDRRVLGIGDGGNDVAMIQEATVGVGIVGKEGRQASRAADYSFGKFRFLRPLLLVHGHYSFARSAYITQYCFYKSMLIAWVQMQYNMSCDFSGMSYWNSFQLVCWNGLFTLPGPFLYGLDRIAPRRCLLSRPSLYRECQRSAYLTNRSFYIEQQGRGFLQAAVMLWLTLHALGVPYVSPGDGHPMDYGTVGTVTYTAMLFMQSWVLIVDSNTLALLNVLSIVLMPLLYVMFVAVYAALPMFEYYGVFERVAGDGAVVLLIIVLTVAPMIPHTAAVAARMNFWPLPTDVERRDSVSFDSKNAFVDQQLALLSAPASLISQQSSMRTVP